MLKRLIFYRISCNREIFLATKVRLDLSDKSSDILGISAMIVHDLKRKRQRDYTFDWDAALDVSDLHIILFFVELSNLMRCINYFLFFFL